MLTFLSSLNLFPHSYIYRWQVQLINVSSLLSIIFVQTSSLAVLLYILHVCPTLGTFHFRSFLIGTGGEKVERGQIEAGVHITVTPDCKFMVRTTKYNKIIILYYNIFVHVSLPKVPVLICYYKESLNMIPE